MHPTISIDTLSLAPAPFCRQIESAARMGARAISPALEQVLDFAVTETARALGDAQLDTVTLTHRALAYATSGDMQAGRERLKRTIGIAMEIGAKCVTMATGGRDTLPCRAVPGDGAIPLERLIRAISRTGFPGPFDLEMNGPRPQAEGDEAGLRRAAYHIGELLERAG